ncbi:Cytochrome c family protein [gamma proteobacterium HdN1]|nr:Cytochrome c family protein [gamma proteobacterium HdN1]
MKKQLFLGALLSVVTVSSLAASGASRNEVVNGEKIAREGNGRGAVGCLVCHGMHGEGVSVSGFPRLAGLNARYLEKQLNDFVSGARDNVVMKPTATALSEDERRAVADYYSKLSVPERVAITLESNEVGEALALRGKWDQQVPACIQCHGPNGVGIGEHFPPLSGQSALYLANQMREWKKGSRANDPLGLMKHVAQSLTESEILAVAKWFSSQPTFLVENSDITSQVSAQETTQEKVTGGKQ